MHTILSLLPLAALLNAIAVPSPPEAGLTQPLPAGLVTPNGGVKVPDGPDGIFMIQYNPTNATEQATITTLELLNWSESDSDLSKRSSPSPHEAVRRDMPINDHGCTNNLLNDGDYLHARDALRRSCDNGNKIPAARHPAHAALRYVRAGSVVVYGCSYGGVQPCGTDEIFEMERYLEKRCGRWGTGWIWMQSWKKGYGRLLHDEEGCGRTFAASGEEVEIV